MSEKPKSVLYITYDGLLEPLGQSQVLAYQEKLAVDDAIHILSSEKAENWDDEDNCEALAAKYLQGLQGTDLVLPFVPEWAKPAWHLFVVRTKQRTDLQEHLEQNGVGSLIHYPIPPHKQAAYVDMNFAPDAFPLDNAMADEVLSLPMGPHLNSESVAEVIKNIGNAQ